MIPIPYILYDSIAFPLKLAASSIGEQSLNWAGIPVLREGNMISLPNIQLEVADACLGIRSLMALVALASAASYIMDLGPVKGAILVFAAVPISLATNSVRIVVTGILLNDYGRKAAEGFYHDFSGWLISLAGMSLILATSRLLMRRGAKAGTKPAIEPPKT